MSPCLIEKSKLSLNKKLRGLIQKSLVKGQPASQGKIVFLVKGSEKIFGTGPATFLDNLVFKIWISTIDACFLCSAFQICSRRSDFATNGNLTEVKAVTKNKQKF